MKQPQININDVAGSLPRPVFNDRRGRPRKGNEVKPIFEANRKGIAKLRQRGFAPVEIFETLQRWGLTCTYPAFYSWFKTSYLAR